MRKSINLKSNNKGSGIVTVLIAVVFLVLMASLLLMLTYTTFEIKASDREGKQTTYDASTVMDEIRLGIEKAVSDSFSEAYSDSLKNYSREGSQVQTGFSAKFVSDLKTWKDRNGKQLIINENKYSKDVIEAMAVNCRNGEVTVNDTGFNVVYDRDDEGNITKITFKDVDITYKNRDYSSEISTDIVVTVPDIGYSLSKFSVLGQQTFSGLPNFTAVCGGTLRQSGNNVVTLTGGAYANNIKLEAGTSRFVLQDGIYVCGGDITVGGYTGGDSAYRLSADTNTTLWARNITLENNGSAAVLGNTFVNNDLNFSGRNAKAKLGGKFIGFGTDMVDATKSSSITVNAKEASLDIEDLSELTLSGISFVGESENQLSGAPAPVNVPMGESMTVKNNQRVYLVPDGYITYEKIADSSKAECSNPDILSGTNDGISKDSNGEYIITKADTKYKLILDTVKPLWTKGVTDYNLGYYNASVMPVCTIVGGQNVVHYFLVFNNTGIHTAEENANEYFKDYAEAYPEKIEKYITDYLSISESNVTTRTMGNTFVGGTALTLKEYMSNTSSAAIGVLSESAQYAKLYGNACKTLSYDIVTEETGNPFDYYIDKELIEEKINGGQKVFKDKNGKVLAVIADNEGKTAYTYTGEGDEQEDLCMIVATGNVNISSDFDGLVMCGGDLGITANASLSANSRGVEGAYIAIEEGTAGTDDERMVGTYFGIDISKENSWSEDGAEAVGSMSAIVTYSGWKKK